MKLGRQRDRRTRTIQTLFGTVVVHASRISISPCSNTMGFFDLSFSPLAHLLPDRCMPELRRVQAELGARHSFRESGRLLSTLYALLADQPRDPPQPDAPCRAGDRGENAKGRGGGCGLGQRMVVMIDGAHIRAAHDYQSRHLDVTVGKIEVAGFQPRRFALAPKGADHPLRSMRAALVEQDWQPGRPLTVMSDGQAALPNLVRAATGEPVRHILDWIHLSMRVRPLVQVLLGLAARHLPGPEPVQATQASIERARHLL